MNMLLFPQPLPAPRFHLTTPLFLRRRHNHHFFQPPLLAAATATSTSSSFSYHHLDQHDDVVSIQNPRYDFSPLLQFLSTYEPTEFDSPSSSPTSLNPTEFKLAEFYRAVPAPLWHTLLKSLSSESSSISTAYSLVTWLQKHNLCFSYELLYSILIHALGRSEKLYEAFLLSQRQTLTPLTYNALIGACARNDDLEKALNLMAKMRRDGYQSDFVNYSLVIQSLTRSNKIDSAMLLKLYEEIEADKIELDGQLLNDITVGFAKAGDVNRAMFFLGLIQGIGLSPKTATLVGVISELGNLGRTEEAEAVFEELKEGGLKPRTRAYNALLKGYVKRGSLKDAEWIVSEMESSGVLPDEHTYSLLIDAYGNAGRWESARIVLKEMEANNVQPNSFVFSRILANYRDRGEWQKSFQVLKEMKSCGVQPDRQFYNVMIDTFGKYNCLDHAMATLERMRDEGIGPDTVTWNTLIDCHCKSGHHNKAEELFEALHESGCLPCTTTYNIMINSFGEQERWECVKNLLGKMQSQGLLPNVITYTTLIDIYGKSGRFNDAIECLEVMKSAGLKPSTTMYNALINAYAQRGLSEQAVNAFRVMRGDGLKPSNLALNSLINAFGEDRRDAEAFAVLQYMKENDLKPDVVTYTTLMKLTLLNEWDEHPALRKILDVIEMVLAIPLNTPLAKALSALQFLLSRVRTLQETVSKFPLADQLEPIYLVVSSWQKLEFECWPALLNEVQAQFEINAGKLWFPLYSVLQRRHSADTDEYNQSTIQSLEEFIQTSSLGEFRKRLQLLFAFHGQISTGIYRGCYSSSFHMENVKILYNIFGFYAQFLPTILEHTEASRKSMELELKELLKLCRWERSDSYLTMEISKRTRQKLRKLIQKYTDLLQQPVMLVLTQEAARRGIQVQSPQIPNLLGDSFEKNRHILSVACDPTQFSDENRSLWLTTWRNKVDIALQNFHHGSATNFDFPYISFKDVEEVVSNIRKCVASHSLGLEYQEERKQVWYTIETICKTAIDCGEIWKDEKKSLGKRRALFDMLKLLDSCGLSKHRSTFLEDQVTRRQNFWVLQPSYDLKHLLLTEGMPSMDIEVAALEEFQHISLESQETEWKMANQYFFKSIASVHHLRQICFNFHKDFTLEQVTRSGSYLDHLISIEQEQRAAAYNFSKRLKYLRDCMFTLENLFSSSTVSASVTSSECSISRNQQITFKCMWRQKQILDILCATMHDESLLLRTVENSHLTTCQNAEGAARPIRLFIEKFVPDFHKSKDLLDRILLGYDRVITTEGLWVHPHGVTKEMEQLVHQNFLVLREFEDHLCDFRKQYVDGGSVKDVLLGHFLDILGKGKLIAEEYNSVLQARNHLENSNDSRRKTSGLEARFGETLTRTYKRIIDAVQSVCSLSGGHTLLEESPGNISIWINRFMSNVANLQLEAICDDLIKTINFAGEMVNCNDNENPNLHFVLGARLKHLYSLLDPLQIFSDSLLHDFLAMHRSVCMMTHVVARLFASLYSQGFGVSAEDHVEDTGRDVSQDANGTGMGEGAGVNDVSDQINDEDQLLGAFEKPNEEKDASNDVPSENDKGIEMEQDFAGNTYSVSEDTGDDNDDDDGEDEQLDSAMGDSGVGSDIVDEKLLDKDDKDNPNNTNEKYESGSSVQDKDPTGRELRAKEDSADVADEAGDLAPDEFDEPNDDNGGQEGPDSTEDMQDMKMDKEEAFSDPTGFNLDEPNPGTDKDVDIDESEGSADPMEDAGMEELDEHKNGEEETNSIDENPNEAEAEAEQLAGNSEKDDPKNDKEKITEMDLLAPKKDSFGPGTSILFDDHAPNAESATQPQGDSHAASLRDVAPEATWSNSNDIHNDLAPSRGLPNSSENEIAVADSSKSGKLSDDLPNTQLPQPDSASLKKIQPNPYRNVGDALEKWKERVKVSGDVQDNNVEALDDMVDENADEYKFTSEFEKGTAQALGPAVPDQINSNNGGNEADGDGRTADGEENAEMEVDEQQPETHSIKNYSVTIGEKIEEPMELPNLEMQPEGSPEVHSHDDGDATSLSQSLVSMRKSYMSEDIHQLDTLSLSENKLGKAQNLEEMSSDVKDDANTLWRKYELLTTRLSQELAEQLRLVMEPTLASKLQGDYKTGKRINMKKVIPYIASQYRKDKIWLRRTRPNKRDYQVVIAVDDSRSMSESRCGDVAIEALVTVCRAMSQLEVGNLAVASFGRKGNIRLLHDFDHPFTGEAGVKMLSSLTFKQENTIADEPMVDLLKYLNNMLDDAVANARLSSGHNPLQQLVLIIADGRFHEKENLKRCVRDILSKKRMVAFLLLDSPQESIMDLMEASFQGGNVKFSKYMDSFPFPFYVLLKNIEALPRTLADLLRQWFELMQYSRD